MKEQELKKQPPADDRFAIIKRVNRENPSADDLLAFRKLTTEKPEMWIVLGDMMMQAREHYITSLKTAALNKETMRLHIEDMRKNLASENDGKLEKLLIDQVIFCWVRLSIIEQQYTTVMKESHTLTMGIYWEKRLSAAHKRYQKACESLARVRKLTRPAKPGLQAKIAILNSLTGTDHLSSPATGRFPTEQLKILEVS